MANRLSPSRFTLAFMLAILSLTLGACYVRFKGSDFEIISLIPHIGPRHSNLNLKLSSTLTFDRDVSVSVDNLLSRSREGDTSVAQLARDFLAPGFALLAEYGMGVGLNLPTVKPEKRRIEFETPWSEWATPGEVDGKSLCGEVFGNNYNCELRAKLQNASAEFNPLMPRQVSIRAAVKIQARQPGDDGWVAARVSPDGKEKLHASLVRRLARRYQEYFKQHGMNVTITGPESK